MKLSAGGKFLATANLGDSNAQGLAVDRQGQVYVAMEAGREVVRLSPELKTQAPWGKHQFLMAEIAMGDTDPSSPTRGRGA